MNDKWGSCQYDQNHAEYVELMKTPARFETLEPLPFTAELVTAIIDVWRNNSADLWSAAPTIADFVFVNWLEFTRAFFPNPDFDLNDETALACAAMSIHFGVQADAFANFDT